MLSYGLERKEAFEDNKNAKNGYLPKGLTHGCGQTTHNFF